MKEIGIFATVLDTPDNVKIIVPNSAIASGTITNFSAYDTRRNDLVMGIAYDDDIGRAIEVIQRVLDAEPRVHKEPVPVIAVSELGDSSVNLVVRPWCAGSDYWPLRFDLTRRLKEELDKRRADLGYRTAAFVVNYSLPACVRACVPACLPRDSCPHTRPILSAAGLCHSN